MNRSEFEARLNKIYDSAVKPVTRYVNERCSMLFTCSKCGAEFWGKASHMIGNKNHQRHRCTMPYGDKNGERLIKISGKRPTHKKNKKKSNDGERFYEMVIQDYTYQQIAKELQINPNIVKDYFKDEGLIE